MELQNIFKIYLVQWRIRKISLTAQPVASLISMQYLAALHLMDLILPNMFHT